MPTYDYRCEANQETHEVVHPMSEQIHTWGELCELLGISPGDTAPDAKVSKVLGGHAVVKSSALKNPEAPPCMSGGGCSGGGCGI